MKDNEKKVNKAEEVKEEVQTEEDGVQLADEQLSQVSGGTPRRLDTTPPQTEIDERRVN